jgi:flagellar basal body-associated protein FliL
MSALLIILTVVFLLILASGAVIWLFLRSRRVARPDQPTAETAAEAPVFRCRYITLPVAVFILTVAMVGYFYRLLPP